MVLTVIDDSDFNDYLWECHQDHMSKCADSFLSEPLWNGKNFNQIQEDVLWTDW